MIDQVRDFLAGDDGPTAVEYAVMLMLIVPVVMAVFTALAGTVSGTFSSTSSVLGGGS
jgi:pilus assembly protein Flp/PilA